jgi:hypothetical protein
MSSSQTTETSQTTTTYWSREEILSQRLGDLENKVWVIENSLKRAATVSIIQGISIIILGIAMGFLLLAQH